MSQRSFEDHVAALLSRRLAEAKTLGIPNPGQEASAVFESIALALVLQPRAALHFEMLARNGLLAELSRAQALCDVLTEDINDLGNVSYKITGAEVLQRARVSLLQLESLPRVSAESVALRRFNAAVDLFLEDHLAQNVRRSGATSMLRPSQEAKADLPVSLEALKTVHAAVRDRLYKLMTGIPNFLNAPFSAVLGTTTVSRARLDLENIIDHVETTGDASLARDIAVRLIGSQSTLGLLSQVTNPLDPILPAGSTASSPAASATITSLKAPFSLTGSPTLSVTVDGESESFNFFTGDAAMIISRPVTFPMTLYGALTVSLDDGTAIEILLDGTYASASALSIGMSATTTDLLVVPFADPTRLLFYAPGKDLVTVLAPTDSAPNHASLCPQLGLWVGQDGTPAISAQDATDAVNALYTLVTATNNADGTITLLTVKTAPTTTLTVVAPTSLGCSGTYTASSSSISIGTTDQRDLVQVGDRLQFGREIRFVAEVEGDNITLDNALASYLGTVTGQNALVVAHNSLATKLASVVPKWRTSRFAEDLITLDRALAPLIASQAPAQRHAAAQEVAALKTLFTSLLSELSTPSTIAPTGSAEKERQVAEGILSTLTERKYDRAVDLLLRCDLQALLEMTLDTASYGSNFMKSIATVAQTVVRTVDYAEEDVPSSVSAGHQ